MSGRLPKVVETKPIIAAKITMDNGEVYNIKNDDIVAIQFIKNDSQILIRKGRIQDIIIVNPRAVTPPMVNNASRIILDCSEQFTVKTIEIKIKDIIKIGGIDDEFDDYSDRITELELSSITEDTIPTREGGMEE